jgi:hypothetical protein
VFSDRIQVQVIQVKAGHPIRLALPTLLVIIESADVVSVFRQP